MTKRALFPPLFQYDFLLFTGDLYKNLPFHSFVDDNEG